MYVIQIVGLVNGRPTPHDGKYVFSYDPGPARLSLGECSLMTVSSPSAAKRYATHADAHAEYMRIDPRQPVRPWDGKPNRPLTAYTVAFLPLT